MSRQHLRTARQGRHENENDGALGPGVSSAYHDRRCKKGRLGPSIPPLMAVLVVAIVAAGLLARVFAANDREDSHVRGGAGVLPVATLRVHYQDSYETTVAFTGRVRAAAVSRLAFEQAGRILAIPLREGDRFAPGDILARLDDSRLKAEEAAASARLKEAQADRDLARQTFRRNRALFKAGHVSRQRLDEAEARLQAAEAAVEGARAQLRRIRVALAQTRIRAPFAGIVTRRLVDEGTVVAAGTPVLAVLTTDRPIEALVGLPASEAEHLVIGRGYRVRLADGREVDARLAGLVPQLQPGSRVLTARLVLPAEVAAPDGALVSLVLTRRVPARGFWLPIEALTADLRGLWRVYALEEDAERGWPYAHVRFENVQILHTSGDRVYVTGTVREGAWLIATGLHRVVPGMLVRAEGEGAGRPGEDGRARPALRAGDAG